MPQCNKELILNIRLTFSKSPAPWAKDIKRCVAAAIELFRNPSMEITPPTTLNKPKSATPKAAKISRVEYSDIKTVMAIRAYRIPVFLATRLAASNYAFFKSLSTISFTSPARSYFGSQPNCVLDFVGSPINKSTSVGR